MYDQASEHSLVAERGSSRRGRELEGGWAE